MTIFEFPVRICLRRKQSFLTGGMDMNMVCLDLEGVLVPEIWIAFSEESGIPEMNEDVSM